MTRTLRHARRCLATGIMALVLSASSTGTADGIKLNGPWELPIGVIRIVQKGNNITGKLTWKNKLCPFKIGEEIFNGILLEDSLSGQVRYCLKGKECSGDDWAIFVMVVAREAKVLAGAAHYKPTACQVAGKGKGDGLTLRKLKPRPPSPTPLPQPPQPPPDRAVPDKSDDHQMQAEVKPLDPADYEKNKDQWRAIMEEAKAFMDSGFFERARKKFIEASELDPTRPEAFNGIGVTYYARQDYDEALTWYKKSLETDPNFGDAYYNMACIYSLKKKLDLAFNYLHIAALDGFAVFEGIEQDNDLANLRSDKRYAEILKEMRKK
jgi:hypothetical protein